MRPNIESEAKYVSWSASSFYARTKGEGSKVKASSLGCEGWVLIRVAHTTSGSGDQGRRKIEISQKRKRKRSGMARRPCRSLIERV